MKHQTVSREKTLTHIYVRQPQTAVVQPCWSDGERIYCGACRQGTVEAVVGAICPVCASVVERIFALSVPSQPPAEVESPALRRQAKSAPVRSQSLRA